MSKTPRTFTERPLDGGSYSYDPATGVYTELEPTTAPPEGKTARLAREAAEAEAETALKAKPAKRERGVPNTTNEE